MIIYKITNKINGKVYIGQTTYSLNHRWSGHKQNTNKCSYIAAAIQKYGHESFTIEQIDTAETFDELNEKEIYWINFYDSCNREKGYNLLSGGNQPRHSEVSKIKMSNARKGKKHTKEHCENIAKGNTGKIVSEKTKELISKANTGQKRRSWTEEEKKQISERRKGKKASPEAIANMKKAAKKRGGPIMTEERKEKIRQGVIKQWERQKKNK